MKNIKYFIIILCCLLVFSCKKESSTTYTNIPLITFSLKSNNQDPGFFNTKNQSPNYPSPEYFLFRMSGPVGQSFQTIYNFDITAVDINKGIGTLSIIMPGAGFYSNIQYKGGTALPETFVNDADGGRRTFSIKTTEANKLLEISGTFIIPNNALPLDYVYGGRMIGYATVFGYGKNNSYSCLDWQLQRNLGSGQNWGTNYY